MQHISFTDNLHHLCSSVLQFPWFNFTALKSSATNLQSLFIAELSISYSTSTNFFICNTSKESQIALFAVRSTSNTLQQAPNGVPARLYVSERVVGGAPATINARPAQRATKRKLRSEAYILSSGPTHTTHP